jgi:hypothetical protein
MVLIKHVPIGHRIRTGSGNEGVVIDILPSKDVIVKLDREDLPVQFTQITYVYDLTDPTPGHEAQ